MMKRRFFKGTFLLFLSIPGHAMELSIPKNNPMPTLSSFLKPSSSTTNALYNGAADVLSKLSQIESRHDSNKKDNFFAYTAVISATAIVLSLFMLTQQGNARIQIQTSTLVVLFLQVLFILYAKQHIDQTT